MIRKTEESAPDIRRLQLLVSDTQDALQGQGGVYDQLAAQNQSIQALLTIAATTPASPVANLLWNGEEAHSVHTWHDDVDPSIPADKNYESAWWYSNNSPATAQNFTTISVANQIPLAGHNFTTGCEVDLITTGTLPTGLAVLTAYFVIVVSSSVVSLATTIGNAEAGTATPITASTGSGTHTIQQFLPSTDSRTSAVNNELKTYQHSTYNPRYSRWDSVNGWAALTGTTTIDQYMPSNLIDATTPLARVSLVAARINEFIEMPVACLMFAGIWDNTSGQRKFLTGDVGFTATLEGTPGTVTRKYKILLTSDRGFTILSSEVTIVNAPSDAQFSATRNIAMSWLQQAGQLQVEIYEYLPNGGDGVSAPQYRLLTQISSATSYIHEGAYLRVVSGYPASTQAARTATFFSSTGDMRLLAINAVSSTWSTVNFPIGVPNNYNKANTTNREWTRIGLTVAPNLFISGVTTNGTTTITIPTGAVNSAVVASGGYGTGSGSLYAGLTVQVYDSGDALLATTTITSVTSNTVLVLAASVATGTDRKIRIVGGGFHGVVIDKIHLGYQQNTSYVPNAFDIRTLNPVAAPVNSDQGGVGDGGDGGGIWNCVARTTPIKQLDGTWVEIQDTKAGEYWASKSGSNMVLALRTGTDNIRRVRSGNGIELYCTDTESFIVNENDVKGVPLCILRKGDAILTEVDGKIELSYIAEISAYSGQDTVYTPVLSQSHIFLAGKLKLVWWKAWFYQLIGKRLQGGIFLHNSKSFGPGDFPPAQ